MKKERKFLTQKEKIELRNARNRGKKLTPEQVKRIFGK